MIHFIYPHDTDRIAAPWSIGNHVAAGLRNAGYGVRQYDWDYQGAIYPMPMDILLGHPHPMPGRVFTNSANADWHRVVAMTPWGGEQLTRDMINGLLDHIHHTLLICGPYWAKRVPPEWKHLHTCVDMAIEPTHYPRIKHRFNPPGKRRFLYIGCTTPNKGTDLIQAILPCDGEPIGHIGLGEIPSCAHYGYFPDMRNPAALRVIAQHDYLLCPGINDANPTTALEALSWGLVPICTVTSGWDFPGVPKLPRNHAAAGRLLAYLQYGANPAKMYSEVAPCLAEYTWERFTNKVLAAIGPQSD